MNLPLRLKSRQLQACLTMNGLLNLKVNRTDMETFAKAIDDAMRKQNIYYDDLIVGNILQKVVITSVAKNGFQDYMKSIGKLGGQNKIPRLSDNRNIVALLNKK